MAATPERARLNRDFFFELMKDTQRLRASFLAERERWLRSLAVDGREEILFEFEMLLRGMERFFNLHNLAIDEQPVVARDFTDEIRSVRDTLSRCVKLARLLLDPPSDRKLVFRKYVETKVVDDRVRRELMEAELEQATPQESLFLIRSGFVAIRGVLDHLMKLDHARYQLFADVGQLVLREIALNKYFKPFRALEFRQEYDRIKNVRVLEVINGISESARTPVSTAFLALYRLIHYLRFVPNAQDAYVVRSQVVLALVRSEIGSLAAFFEVELATALGHISPPMSAVAASIAQDLRRDTAAIVKTLLSGAGVPANAGVPRARQAFLELFRKSIGQLVQLFERDLTMEQLFDEPANRKQQALRLRLDLFAFREVAFRASHGLSSRDTEQAEAALIGMKSFLSYFREVSYQLLRYSDFDPFERFTALMAETEALPSGPGQRQRLAEDFRRFGDSLEKTLKAVSRREELKKTPLDMAEAFRVADCFLAPVEK